MNNKLRLKIILIVGVGFLHIGLEVFGLKGRGASTFYIREIGRRHDGPWNLGFESILKYIAEW